MAALLAELIEPCSRREEKLGGEIAGSPTISGATSGFDAESVKKRATCSFSREDDDGA